jgi:hypothetical protein
MTSKLVENNLILDNSIVINSSGNCLVVNRPVDTLTRGEDGLAVLSTQDVLIKKGLMSRNIVTSGTTQVQGMIGETVKYTLITQTNLNNAATFTNFPTNIITPSVGPGVWLVRITSQGAISGSSTSNPINYRIVSNDGATDTNHTTMTVSFSQTYCTITSSAIITTTSPATTFRLQGQCASNEFFVRMGAVLMAVRIA